MKAASLPGSHAVPVGGFIPRKGLRTLLGLAAMCLLPQAYAQGVVVYAQNFETVNPSGTTCSKFGNVAAGLPAAGPDDAGSLTDDYNGTGQEGTSAVFTQVATADRLCWNNPAANVGIRLVDPSGIAGAYSGSFGRNATTNVESWAIAVDPQGHPFLNGSIDLSIITPGSVNPALGQTTPEEFTLAFYAIPSATYSLAAAPAPLPNSNPASPAIVQVPAGAAVPLQSQTVSVSKAPGTSRYQSEWQTHTFSVDASSLTPGQRVVMVSTARYPSNYFAFDNIRLTAAPTATPELTIACNPTDLYDSPNQVATCTVTANQPVNAALTVPFTGPAASGRYTTDCASPFQIPVGASSASCTITATANAVPGDGADTATLALQAGTGYTLGTAQAQVTVHNDDAPPLLPVASLRCAPPTLTDSAGQVATCTVTLDAPAPAGGLSLNLTPPAGSARYGSDCASPLAVAAGGTTATCEITATANMVPGDGSATATLTLLAGAGYTLGTAQAQVTVNDDDAPPLLLPVANLRCVPATLTDSAGQVASCTVTLGAPAPAGGLSLNLTPPAGSTRYGSGCASPLVVAAGDTSASCQITATANTVPGDGSATATLTLRAGTGYTLGTAQAQVTVNDDDLAPVPGLNLWGLLLASLGLGALTWRRQRG